MGDLLQCSLCLGILFKPVTTPCGHSFCRSCIGTSFDYNRVCPLCRSPILIKPQAITISLENRVKAEFSSTYNKILDKKKDVRGPVSILITSLPSMLERDREIMIRISEQRYRVMLNNLLNKNIRNFCAVLYDPSNNELCTFAHGREIEIIYCTGNDEHTDLHILTLGRVEILSRRLVDDLYWEATEVRDIAE